MSIFKRGKTYHLDIPLANGKRLRRSAETSDRKAAQELHDQLKAQLWRQDELGEVAPHSFDEAAEEWLRSHENDSAIRDYRHHIKFWSEALAGLRLDEIKRPLVAQIVEKLVTRKNKPASDGTKNNYVITLRSVLSFACKEREWLTFVPAFRTYGSKKDSLRQIIATPAQAKALLEVLPPQLRSPVQFAFMTGLRKANVFGLTWDRVDLERSLCWVWPNDTKAGNLIVCPLNSAAKAMLESLPRVAGEQRVFPVEAPCWHQWNRYTKRAGLPAGFRFHDIRHSFASWAAMDGIDRKTLQEMLGHKTPTMLDRYVHLPTDHLVSAAEKVAARLH